MGLGAVKEKDTEFQAALALHSDSSKAILSSRPIQTLRLSLIFASHQCAGGVYMLCFAAILSCSSMSSASQG